MITRVALFLATAAALHGADFIRQIQTVSGQSIIYDISLANDEGSVNSKPLAADSAVFQLYTSTVSNGTTTLKKLDEKTVATFLPVVTATVLSEDSYYPPRTRADKPYGIRITVSNMQSASATVPDYAKKVQVARSYKLYESGTYLPTTTTGTYADSSVLRANGTFTDNAILQRLPVTTPTKAVGQESFTVYLHPDLAAPQSELAKATVQIWPVADATISNIEEGKTYKWVPQDGSIAAHDIYPGAAVYAQVYSGPYTVGTTGRVLPATVVNYAGGYLPQNAQLALSGLDQVIIEDGEYTIEFLTITPFNGGAPEILTHVTFSVKRSIEVRGGVTTME
ncbi:hypothetical protein [Luteolibacter sp. Populi]|uniref:hypothetical protein n=1 Tax=Luteolibacter sp. Populi TaxID=3230487 RepID=UPI003466ACE2